MNLNREPPQKCLADMNPKRLMSTKGSPIKIHTCIYAQVFTMRIRCSSRRSHRFEAQCSLQFLKLQSLAWQEASMGQTRWFL